MSKTQKILVAIIIFGICVSIALLIYSIQTTPKLEKITTISGEPYHPDSYPSVSASYSNSTLPSPKNETLTWKVYQDDELGIRISYPEELIKKKGKYTMIKVEKSVGQSKGNLSINDEI